MALEPDRQLSPDGAVLPRGGHWGFRVRLLSIPQARQAPAMPSAAQGTPVAVSPVQDSSTPPTVISAIPKAILRSKFYLNTNHASSAVRTPSRFRSREAEAAGVEARPSMGPRPGGRGGQARGLRLPARAACRGVAEDQAGGTGLRGRPTVRGLEGLSGPFAGGTDGSARQLAGFVGEALADGAHQ